MDFESSSIWFRSLSATLMADWRVPVVTGDCRPSGEVDTSTGTTGHTDTICVEDLGPTSKDEFVDTDNVFADEAVEGAAKGSLVFIAIVMSNLAMENTAQITC